jgi:multidrug efflux pump subunit AcrB
MYLCVYVYMYVFVYVPMYTVYVCVYVCMYVCTMCIVSTFVAMKLINFISGPKSSTQKTRMNCTLQDGLHFKSITVSTSKIEFRLKNTNTRNVLIYLRELNTDSHNEEQVRIPVAVRSKTWVCCHSLAGTAGSNPAGTWIFVS